jgi:hypothetical protein
MWSLPKNSESTELTIHASSPNSTVMASAKVGDGFCRAIADSSRELQVRGSYSWLLHQIGGSKTIGEHYYAHSPEILLAKSADSEFQES